MNNTNINTTTHIANKYNLKYTVTEEKYENDGNIRVSYGINVFYETDGITGGAPCACVHDISSDKNAIETLVDKCNRSNASLEHIYEIIDDFFDMVEV